MEKNYEEFNARFRDGRIFTKTCDPNQLSELEKISTVTFDRAVLDRFYKDSQYAVEMWILEGPDFRIQIDKSIDYINTLLYQLGDLPINIQKYFRSYMLDEPRCLSKEALRCWGQGMPVTSSSKDYIFRDKYLDFNQWMKECNNFEFYKTIPDDKKKSLQTLRIPTGDLREEFELQIKIITFCLIELLNLPIIESKIKSSKHFTKEISEKIKKFHDKNESIKIVELYLHIENNIQDDNNNIKFLKELKKLRNKLEHSQTVDDDELKKCYEYFKINEGKWDAGFDNVLEKGISYLDYLKNAFKNNK